MVFFVFTFKNIYNEHWNSYFFVYVIVIYGKPIKFVKHSIFFLNLIMNIFK